MLAIGLNCFSYLRVLESKFKVFMWFNHNLQNYSWFFTKFYTNSQTRIFNFLKLVFNFTRLNSSWSFNLNMRIFERNLIINVWFFLEARVASSEVRQVRRWALAHFTKPGSEHCSSGWQRSGGGGGRMIFSQCC